MNGSYLVYTFNFSISIFRACADLLLITCPHVRVLISACAYATCLSFSESATFLIEKLRAGRRMADTSRQEQELKQKAAAGIDKAKDPIEKLRLKCLARGASGIKGLGRYVA